MGWRRDVAVWAYEAPPPPAPELETATRSPHPPLPLEGGAYEAVRSGVSARVVHLVSWVRAPSRSNQVRFSV